MTPRRRSGSVRRTTTHDSFRPHGIRGDIQLVGTGRDLLTGSDGEPKVLDAARLEARIDYFGGRRILAIETGPTRTALTELVGCAAAGGYRAALDAALPGERERGRVLYQLLDDIPSTILVNGYAMAVGLPPT